LILHGVLCFALTGSPLHLFMAMVHYTVSEMAVTQHTLTSHAHTQYGLQQCRGRPIWGFVTSCKPTEGLQCKTVTGSKRSSLCTGLSHRFQSGPQSSSPHGIK